MDIEKARFNMIEQQIRPWDVLDPDVLNLLHVVKREAFVPEAYKSLAFFDTEIPLPNGENMLAPKFEARMLEEAEVKKHENVLEIGAGSGYMAALLAHMARHVTTVEIDPEIKALAEKNLANYGVTNVDVVLGNGANGYAGSGNNGAPYDLIIISGSMPELPQAFLDQLKVGGRVLAVIGKAPIMSAQKTTHEAENKFNTVKLFETNIKPLREIATAKRFKF